MKYEISKTSTLLAPVRTVEVFHQAELRKSQCILQHNGLVVKHVALLVHHDLAQRCNGVQIRVSGQ